MAKGKNAAALFEVINKGKGIDKRGTVVEAAPRPEPASKTPAKVTNDSEKGRFTFHLSYSNVILACFTLAVAVALAVIVGQRFSGPTAPKLAPMTSEQLRAGPANPAVLDVRASVSNPSGAPLPLLAQPGTPRVTIPTPANAPAPVQRDPKLNYVIVQSYPDEKSANDARDVLVRNGIDCTVEKGLPFAPNWFVVVGTRGFERVKVPEFEEYIKRIQAIGASFAGNSRFKKFEPHGYKWK